MRKYDIDKVVKDLIQSGWVGNTHKDFKERLGDEYSYDQIERVRARYKYIMKVINNSDDDCN